MSRNTQTLQELKISVQNEIKKISVQTLERVLQNMIKRVKLCLESNGNHFQHLL